MFTVKIDNFRHKSLKTRTKFYFSMNSQKTENWENLDTYLKQVRKMFHKTWKERFQRFNEPLIMGIEDCCYQISYEFKISPAESLKILKYLNSQRKIALTYREVFYLPKVEDSKELDLALDEEDRKKRLKESDEVLEQAEAWVKKEDKKERESNGK